MRKVTIPNCTITKRGMEYGITIPEHMKKYTNALLEFCHKNRGGYVSVVMDVPHKPRSTGKCSQCNHFNGDCRQISIETNNSFDVVKYAVKLRALEHGYPQADIDGVLQFDILGNPMPLPEHLASSEQAAILIDTAHLVAAEFNITLEETE